jgi:AcrR family transcriptional regulator
MTAQAEQGRRTDWVATRARILATARDLFGARGYRATTTRDLAEAAGVTPKTLHRHFPSKAGLFEAAVLTPLGEFIEHYLDTRVERRSRRRDTHQDLVEFYDGLLSAIFSEDKLLAAAALTLTYHTELSSDMIEYVGAFFAKLEELMAEKTSLTGTDVDPRIAPRAIVGMALGLSVYRNLLFPAGDAPDREELTTELVKLTLWGIAGRPDNTLLDRN